MNRFQQGQFNPSGETIRFRSDGGRITCIVTGDIDIRRARRLLANFRLFLQRIRRCWTCFQHSRTVINYPCGCYCNCKECSVVMDVCSMCGDTILGTHEGIRF